MFDSCVSVCRRSLGQWSMLHQRRCVTAFFQISVTNEELSNFNSKQISSNPIHNTCALPLHLNLSPHPSILNKLGHKWGGRRDMADEPWRRISPEDKQGWSEEMEGIEERERLKERSAPPIGMINESRCYIYLSMNHCISNDKALLQTDGGKLLPWL